MCEALLPILMSREMFGKRLIGCIINGIPKGREAHFARYGVEYLSGKEIRTFGMIPKDSMLGSISVRELNSHLGGEVLCADRGMDELIEHLSIGAMNVEAALSHFRKTMNKAVISGGDRGDIILAALETSTRCVILTGQMRPSPAIIARAEEKGIPLIMVPGNTLNTVEMISTIMGHMRLREEKKIVYALSVFDEKVDSAAILKAAGIKTKSSKS